MSRVNSTLVYPQPVWISYPHYPHVISLAILPTEEIVKICEHAMSRVNSRLHNAGLSTTVVDNLSTLSTSYIAGYITNMKMLDLSTLVVDNLSTLSTCDIAGYIAHRGNRENL